MFKYIRNWVKQSLDYSSTQEELMKLSTRELADIGISRSDFERISRGNLLNRESF